MINNTEVNLFNEFITSYLTDPSKPPQRTTCARVRGQPVQTSFSTRRIHTEITYWDVLSGSIIRVLQGSPSETIYSMDITEDGKHFVTGGGDGLVKVWDYLRGEVTHVGIAPGGAITGVKIRHHTVVTTSIDGAILTWRFPHPNQ